MPREATAKGVRKKKSSKKKASQSLHCDLCAAPIESLSWVCEPCKAWCRNAPVWRKASRCCAGCDRPIVRFSYCKVCLLGAKEVLEQHARESREGEAGVGGGMSGRRALSLLSKPTTDGIIVGQEVEFEGTVMGRY
ncbi:hypothetical protein FIBSPDRAFT_938816 [Athelia psychrophila]|uniref:Uncharacterized protein n=1 Tax=Athelia psychrophila TaxID=1759441 RepID=A0A167VV81_9AGAM|nr:hypothetical protein FIBSPDRAFT_940469 [Fibularhizoctonia sp. CBS 109695]KZP08705.1 hypothetical protein FIBSPDRAFT_938816 [Fibularhizoctonia sp. CBS 109695]